MTLLLLSPADWAAVRVSVLVAGRAAALGLPFAAGAAYLLDRGRFPGRTLVDALVQAPLVISPVVLGFLLLLVFGVEGPVGRPLLRLFGLRLVFTSAGASLAAGIGAFPLMVRTIRQSFEAIDPRLETAARSLGAGPLDQFFSVTLPLAWPGLLSAAVVGFATCLGEFGAVITFAGDIPGVTETLPLAIYGDLQAPGGEASALRLAAVAVVLALAAVAAADALSRAARRRSET